MTADLHLHTYKSDGENSVEGRAEQAKSRGLETIAIADHDTISGDLEPCSQEISGVEVITGSEIKCEINGTSIEILGCFLDSKDESLNALFDEIKKQRNTDAGDGGQS